MANPLKPIQPGDDLPTSVQTWNPMLAAARAHKTAAPPGAGSYTDRPPEVRIKNTTGSQLDRGAVVFVAPDDDPEITPDDSEDQFQQFPILKGSEFGSSDDQPAVAFVLAQPLADGKIGAAHVTGIVSVKIDIGSADDTHAQYKADATIFKSSTSGWPIVWKQAGTGEKWAYVNLAAAPAPPSVVGYVQAPVGGITARSGVSPGAKLCQVLVQATEDGNDYVAGELVFNGESVTIHNFFKRVAGQLGDRLVQVSGTTENSAVLGWDDPNDGDPTVFKTLST